MLTRDQRTLLNNLRKIAKQQEKRSGVFTEFTGRIGELAACDKLNYSWTPSRGYDAMECKANSDNKNQYTHKNCKKGQNAHKDCLRIQIKTRKLWSSLNFPSGTLSRFGRKDEYEFDTGILVLLDDNFEIAKIWLLDQNEIQSRESRDDGRYKALHVSTFIKEPVDTKEYPNFEPLKIKYKL